MIDLKEKFLGLPLLCRKMILMSSLETLIYGIFYPRFILELYRHISAGEYSASDIIYALIGIILNTIILKYKDNVIEYLRLFLVLDIVTNIIFAIIFVINNDWHFYWIMACTISPCLIQKFINIGVTRIEYNACPDDRMKENRNLIASIFSNTAVVIGGSICMLLSALNIFDLNVWMIFVCMGFTLSSIFYMTIPKSDYIIKKEKENGDI